MSNSTIDVILDHRSIRKFDPTFEIPEDHINLIIQAGQKASSWDNFQMYTIIEIPKELRGEGSQIAGNQKFVQDASYFCIIYLDIYRMQKMLELSGERIDKYNASALTIGIFDAGIMAQNMVIAAESLGYGICYCGDCGDTFDEQKKILNLPDQLVPITGLAIGKGIETPPSRPRYPREVLYHKGEYKRLSELELKEAMEYMSNEYSQIANRPIDWQQHMVRIFTKGYIPRIEKIRRDTLINQGFCF